MTETRILWYNNFRVFLMRWKGMTDGAPDGEIPGQGVKGKRVKILHEPVTVKERILFQTTLFDPPMIIK